MTLLARRKDTGAEVEVLALAGDGLALVAPPGHSEEGVLVPRSLLVPDPHEVSLFEGFASWTDRSMRARKGPQP